MLKMYIQVKWKKSRRARRMVKDLESTASREKSMLLSLKVKIKFCE